MNIKKFYFFGSPAEVLKLSVNNTSQANLSIGTHSALPYYVDWGDGVFVSYSNLQTVTKTYTSNYTGDITVITPMGLGDISRIESTGSTVWDFDLGVFIPLNGLTNFYLQALPNANINGSLNSFTGATGLINFQIVDVPNASITGSLNSFSGANELTNFWLYGLPNANITGNSSAFSNKTNLRDFLIHTSLTSNIVMNYDDILNIWQSSVYIYHRYSGISASKATTTPFNFDSMRSGGLYLTNTGLSTQSMDNMIIALDNSIITQASPKNIYLNQNAPHSGSPAVMASLSNLATKNVTVIL